MWSPLHKRPETPFASFPGTCVPSTPYIFTDIYLTFISTPLFRSSAFSNCRQGPLCLLAVYLVAHLVGIAGPVWILIFIGSEQIWPSDISTCADYRKV